MDLYLPVDFYHLRDDLPDWRDAPQTCHETEPARAADGSPRDACADPLWKVL
jgi:hypothetical protein